MFKLLKKVLNRDKQAPPKAHSGQEFTGNFRRDVKLIKELFNRCGDVKFRTVNAPALDNRQVLLVYVEGLVNMDILNRDVVAPLLHTGGRAGDVLKLLNSGQPTPQTVITAIEDGVLSGEILVLAEGSRRGFLVEAKEWPTRSVEEPTQERNIRGPREGFVEVGKVNVALIRRRLPTATLKVEEMRIGRRSKTIVSILWIDDVADSDLVDEVRERLKAIDIDGILDPGAINELITERTATPFPLILSSERPDKVAGGILQGKVAIIADGSPFTLIAPVTFADFYQTPEDYYMHPAFATIARLLRFVSLFFSTTATAAYTAIIAFHYEMIPRDIVVFIAQSREGVPFSPIAEAFFLEIAVELIREASIRLPAPIGPTIGIVGALVLGQAVVEAQLVSPILLIVVAISLMANFTIPNYEAALAVRLIKFPILAMAGFI